MGLYVTGDIHGDCKEILEYVRVKNLDNHDYVIVAGDFGCIWNGSKGENQRLDRISQELDGCNLAFVDGNHENFNLLDKYPVEIWNGGKIHRIRPNIIHLMRGQMFLIEGKRIFCFGGARSQDIRDGLLRADDKVQLLQQVRQLENQGRKLYRIVDVDWWEQEMPSEEEMEEGRKILSQWGWKADFVISHCCPTQVQAEFSLGTYQPDILTDYLQELSEKLQFSSWYFGHYHQDMRVNQKFTMMYHKIWRI